MADERVPKPARDAREEGAKTDDVGFDASATAEADRATLSESEDVKAKHPGATAETFAAQTSKDRGRRVEEDADVVGSALPTEEGHRG